MLQARGVKMNRAFISFYLIIVLSIIILGLILNKVWEVIDPVPEQDLAIEDIITLIENNANYNVSNGNNKVAIELQQLSLNHLVHIMQLEDFSNTAILTSIKDGKIIITSDKNQTFFYKRLNNSNNVLVLSSKNNNYQNTPLYIGTIILFYVVIGIIIFLWVWPLSRDLLKLVQHTHKLGKNGAPQHITISSRSVLFPFAQSFNSMALRLSALIASQKEMTYAISHELRTPLARMKFALVIAEDNGTLAQPIKQLSSIRQDIIEMETLINALLSYASFDQQSQPLHQSAGRIQDLLQTIKKVNYTLG